MKSFKMNSVWSRWFRATLLTAVTVGQVQGLTPRPSHSVLRPNSPALGYSSSMDTTNVSLEDFALGSPTKSCTRTRTSMPRIKARKMKTTTLFTDSESTHRRLPTPAPASAKLTREEEIRYSFQIRTFRAAVRLRDQLAKQIDNDDVSLTESQWAAACGCDVPNLRRVMHEGQQARHFLVAANAGLVTQLAKKYHTSVQQATRAQNGLGTILSLQDMIQEGNLGLMTAAERFEPEKGFRFSTYATYWIRQRILSSINDSSRTIRLPAHVHVTISKIRKGRGDLQQQLGREPTDEELAANLDITVDKLRKCSASSRNVMSFEAPLQGTFKTNNNPASALMTLGDTLASDAPTPDEDAQAEHLRCDIHAVMQNELGPLEREVITLRFGLEYAEPRTLEETAQLLGLSRDKVRGMEVRALNKLRQPQRNYRLKDYVDELQDVQQHYHHHHRAAAATTSVIRPSIDRPWYF